MTLYIILCFVALCAGMALSVYAFGTGGKRKRILFSKVPKHDFLVADAHTLVVAAVIQRDAAVESLSLIHILSMDYMTLKEAS